MELPELRHLMKGDVPLVHLFSCVASSVLVLFAEQCQLVILHPFFIA
jgi:hypothetical protein